MNYIVEPGNEALYPAHGILTQRKCGLKHNVNKEDKHRITPIFMGNNGVEPGSSTIG